MEKTSLLQTHNISNKPPLVYTMVRNRVHTVYLRVLTHTHTHHGMVTNEANYKRKVSRVLQFPYHVGQLCVCSNVYHLWEGKRVVHTHTCTLCTLYYHKEMHYHVKSHVKLIKALYYERFLGGNSCSHVHSAMYHKAKGY